MKGKMTQGMLGTAAHDQGYTHREKHTINAHLNESLVEGWTAQSCMSAKAGQACGRWKDLFVEERCT
jgi:hypothetical protein